MAVLKRILSVILGFIVASIVIFAFEWIGTYLHPSLQHIDPKDPKAIADMMNQMPFTAFLWLLFGYVVGSFVGGLTATMISGRQNFIPSIIVGIILTAGGIINVVTIPHPFWFVVISNLAYLPFAWFGYLAVRHKQP